MAKKGYRRSAALSSRFKKLKDGWIRDKALGLDFLPSSLTAKSPKEAIELAEKMGGRLMRQEEYFSINPVIRFKKPKRKTSFLFKGKSFFGNCATFGWI